jgi:hypothetical protein
MTSPQAWIRGWRLLSIAAALAITGVAAGCSGGNVASHTITQQQATARAEQIPPETATSLDPQPVLEKNPLLTVTDMCVANVPDANEMVNVAYSYWLRGITATQFGEIGQQIKAFWKKKGYTIFTSGGFGTGQPDISGETQDSFLISLDWSAKGEISIGATSPCIYPDGKPPS